MRLNQVITIAAICLLACSAASAQKVTVDGDESANFSGYKTYAYRPGTPTPNQLFLDQRIVSSIEQQLVARGLQKTEPTANPDLIVSYQVAADSPTQVNTTGTGGWGWGYRYGGGMTTTTVGQIPTGTPGRDIGDAKTHKVL